MILKNYSAVLFSFCLTYRCMFQIFSNVLMCVVLLLKQINFEKFNHILLVLLQNTYVYNEITHFGLKVRKKKKN